MPSSIHPQATILLVEDNPTARAALGDILELLGYAVLEAPDGLRALEILAQRPGTVDLVLSDLVLPGMSGVELAQAARALRPGLPLLVVTGYSLLGRDAELAASGVAGWLEKPFTIDQLAGKLAEILGAGDTGARR
jgi:CheY-like chemotaxis protein